ncbi:MAG: hypothetical protein ABFS02_12600 [Pseudomonadota bacterium]
MNRTVFRFALSAEISISGRFCDAIVDDLRELGVWHIHYHQTLFFPKAIFQLPKRLGVQYDYTAHDYLPICPRIVMIDETGYYCSNSQFSTDNCDRCIRYNGFDEHADLKDKYQGIYSLPLSPINPCQWKRQRAASDSTVPSPSGRGLG